MKQLKLEVTEIVAIAAIVLSFPLLLHGGTLFSRTEIRPNAQGELVPYSYKTPFAPLMGLGAATDLGALIYLIMKIRERHSDDNGGSAVLEGSPVPQLPSSSAPVFETFATPPQATTEALLAMPSPSNAVEMASPSGVVANPTPLAATVPISSESSEVSTIPVTQAQQTTHSASIRPRKLNPETSAEDRVLFDLVQKNVVADFLAQLARNRLCIVFAAPPGSGKTTVMRAWVVVTLKSRKDATFFAIGYKHDSWMGLAKAPGFLATPETKVDLDGKRYTDFTAVMRQLDLVYAITDERRLMSEKEREEQPPVWLILDDFFAIQTMLNTKANAKLWGEFQTKIGTIITAGRELNVGVCVGTQSFNVAALGLQDSNIRGCLTVCAMGKTNRTEDGRRDGNFDAVGNILRNPYIVTDETLRAKMMAMLPNLKQVSDAVGLPVLFTTLGEPPQIGLLPDLSVVHERQLGDEVVLQNAKNISRYQKQYGDAEDYSDVSSVGQDLATLFKPEQPSPKTPPTSVPATNSNGHAPTVNPSQVREQLIARIAKLREKGLSPEQIQVVMGWEEEDSLNPTLPNAERRRLIKICREIGLTQTQTILAVWGQKSGGSGAYQRARDIYLELESQAAPGEFPENDLPSPSVDQNGSSNGYANL